MLLAGTTELSATFTLLTEESTATTGLVAAFRLLKRAVVLLVTSTLLSAGIVLVSEEILLEAADGVTIVGMATRTSGKVEDGAELLMNTHVVLPATSTGTHEE